jgi:hypothetical protein
MRSEVLILPTEDPAALAARRDEYLRWYNPESPAAYYYLDMMMTAERLADRCEDAHDAALASNCDDVQGTYEAARGQMVAAQAALLETRPDEGVAALKRSQEGCSYLVQMLGAAAALLASAGSWPLDLAARVVHSLGAFSDPDRIGGSEVRYRLFIYNLHLRAHDPMAAHTLAALSAPARRPAVLQGVDLGRWLPTADVCRQWMQELLAAEVVTLRLLGDALRAGKDGAAHTRVMKMAKMLPERDLSRQYLRYRREADSRYIRGHRALLTTLEHDAEHEDCDDDDDCDEGAAAAAPGVSESPGAAPTVTTEPPAAAEAGKTGKVDSPNEPGNGTTATTVPPAGGNGLLILALFAFLLGQLFGGLDQVKAWAAALGSEQPRPAPTPFVGWVSAAQLTSSKPVAVGCAALTDPAALHLERCDR